MRVVGERIRLNRTGWEEALAHEVSDAQLDDPPGSSVVVEVSACGVCHRDLLDRTGRFPFLRLPITPGHEAAGKVVAVGPEASFRIGDRVGTATVSMITQRDVTFTIQDFGFERQETLSLRKTTEATP